MGMFLIQNGHPRCFELQAFSTGSRLENRVCVCVDCFALIWAVFPFSFAREKLWAFSNVNEMWMVLIVTLKMVSAKCWWFQL